jgi:uncharacterized metal-binding protein
MPSGKVHAVSTIVLSLAGGYLAYSQGWQLPQVGALAGGTLAGILVSPDLDVDRGNISHKIARKGGCLLGLLWKIFWFPYAALIPHRSPLSHLPVLGTALRLFFIYGWVSLIFWLLKLGGVYPVLPGWAWYAVAGLALADGLHWLLDQFIRN